MIRVGGATEVEVKEKKDRVDDALNATRAAVEEGIVAGGGVALLKASKTISAKGENSDQEAGINIVRRALQAPIRQIAENAGDEGSIVVGKVLEGKGNLRLQRPDRQIRRHDLNGYHRPCEGCPSRASGRSFHCIGLLITTEAMVAEAPKKDAPAAPAMPDMGGMGGMM